MSTPKIKIDLNNIKTPKESCFDWSSAQWPINHSFREEEIVNSNFLLETRKKIIKTLTSFGFVVLQFGPESTEQENTAFKITKLTTLIGEPIKIFNNIPSFWRKVDVDLSRPSEKSRGKGKIPLHMDFVNAEDPPDIVCLYCLKSDPFGKGKSVVSNFMNIESELSDTAIKILSSPSFTDGVINNLSNVGSDINPFPVLSVNKKWNFRFTENLIHNTQEKKSKSALEDIINILKTRTMKFSLDEGDLLLIDQHRSLHGRDPVGSRQDLYPISERRILYHSFIRRNT